MIGNEFLLKIYYNTGICGMRVKIVARKLQTVLGNIVK